MPPGRHRRRHARGEFLNGAGHAHSRGVGLTGTLSPAPRAHVWKPRRLFPAGWPRPPRRSIGCPGGGGRGAGGARRAAGGLLPRAAARRGASTHPARSRRVNRRGAICRRGPFTGRQLPGAVPARRSGSGSGSTSIAEPRQHRRRGAQPSPKFCLSLARPRTPPAEPLPGSAWSRRRPGRHRLPTRGPAG